MTENTKAILVTGASSGIGHHLTTYLAERGHPVYATARKPEDLKMLAQIENVIPIEMDVRQPEHVQNALEQVINEGTGLYGLVNNAGIGELGPFNTWTDEDMLNLFDVNVFGPHRVTNAFLPLLVESKGRIITIGSQGGMVTKKYFGPYTMTKHALEAYTTALNEELEPYGVWVSIVQPGGIVTKGGENSIPGILARLERAQPPFKEEADQLLAAFTEPPPPQDEDAPESEANRKPSSPLIVSKAVHHALFAEKPKMRYLVGTRWEGNRVINALMERLLDANEGSQLNYAREELIEFLDHHLSDRA